MTPEVGPVQLSLEGLSLHPGVTLRPVEAAGFELFDARTGLHLGVDDVLGADGAWCPELLALLDALALRGGALPVADVRQRQHDFLDEQTWDERLERLRELLSYAVERVPYYRERAAAYASAHIQHRGSVLELPRMGKADVRGSLSELCADDVDIRAELASGRLELVATSGTTEERLQALSDADLVRVPGNYPAIWGVAEREDTPRTAVLTSATCMAERCTLHPGELAARVVHEHTLYLPALRDPFAIDAGEVRAIADELFEFAPAFLFVNPVYAQCLGRRARELGIGLPRVQMLLTSYQYSSRTARERLRQLFDAPVRNMYSATELGGCQIGLECQRGRLHLRENHCLVELLDAGGDVAPGALGAVVVTTLAGRVMPLVRYVVGDLAARDTRACDCPLWESPSIELHGREKDALFIHGHWWTTKRIDDAIGLEPGLDFYCCRQVGAAALRLEVVPALDEPLDARALQERLEHALGVSVRVERAKRLAPAPSLKYPLTVRGVDAPPWLPRGAGRRAC